MKYQFQKYRFQAKAQHLIYRCNDIIDEYLKAGLRLTLRQLYYQLVTQNIVPNEEKSYNLLSSVVSKGRLAGQIDWGAIEDRTRVPKLPTEFKNLDELVDAAISSYRLPRWGNQDEYIELWVEKDALAGVLQPIAKKYHIPLMVNRGYSSQSAMYEASNRLLEKGGDKPKTILYLGDFDPSGEDMVRDIENRMEVFLVGDFHIVKIALNPDQIKKYKLPPNPAKIKDPRAKRFIAQWGASSWEVDAINPKELQKIIEGAIIQYIDVNKLKAVLAEEEKDKKRLKSFMHM